MEYNANIMAKDKVTYHCTGCGKEQLHSLAELRKLTPAALVHAFQAAGIQSG